MGSRRVGHDSSDLAAAAAAAAAAAGFPGGTSSKEPVSQCQRHKRLGFDPWIGKIPLEKGMGTHFSIFARKIPWREEPGGPQSIGSQRVGHD